MRFIQAIVLFIGLPAVLSASEEDIFSVAEIYNRNKKNITQFEKEKRALLGKIYSLERDSKKVVKEKGRLGNDKILLNRDIKDISREIIVLENRVKSTTRVLHERWEVMQKMRDLPWMYILLSSYGPEDLERTNALFSRLNEAEAKLTISYLHDLQELRAKELELKAMVKEMISVARQISKKEKFIKKQNKEKKKILSQLEKKILLSKKNLAKAKNLGLRLSVEKNLENLKLLFATSFFDRKGSLKHPVDGPLKQGFGLNRALLRDNIDLMHKGYFYSLPVNTEIRSIAKGRVSFFSQVQGLGQVAIVDHGSNYYSIYSFLKKRSFEKGDIVSEGQVIGLSGVKSDQFGPGLYFEIRHFSEAENPENWLVKSMNKEKLALNRATIKGDI